MKRTVFLFVILATGTVFAQLPPITPIVTAEELRLAATEVPVAKIDFILPENQADAEVWLSARFFNQPAERRYAGITSAKWKEKWSLFSDSLVVKAKRAGLDAVSLKSALRNLNQGRNLQTAAWPILETTKDGFGETAEQKKAAAEFQKKAEEKYQLALKAREKNPEPYYDDHLAIIPVGAYLARHAKGECWLIVCKWEHTDEQHSMPLGHIMIWAIDTKSGAVIAYVTCD